VLTGVLQPSGGSVRFKGKDIGGIGTVALTGSAWREASSWSRSFRADGARDAPGRGRLAARPRRPALRFPRGDRRVHADALEVASLFNLADKAHVLARALPQGDKKLLDVAPRSRCAPRSSCSTSRRAA